MYFFNLYTYLTLLFLSFLSSLTIYFRKDQPRYLKAFPPFLLVSFLIEIAAYIFVRKGLDNSSLYHFFFPVEISFFLFVSYHILKRPKIKKAIVFSASIYIAVIGIYYSISDIKGFPTVAYFLGAMLVIIFYSFYFFEIIRLPIDLTPKREENFWIFVGVLLFYLTTLPIWLIVQFMGTFSKGTLEYFSTLLMLMNYALYLSLIIAFFCKRIFRKKESSKMIGFQH